MGSLAVIVMDAGESLRGVNRRNASAAIRQQREKTRISTSVAMPSWASLLPPPWRLWCLTATWNLPLSTPQSTRAAHLFVIYPCLAAPLLPSVSTHYLLTSSRLPLAASVLGHFGGEARSGPVLLRRAAALEISSLLANEQKRLLLCFPINIIIFGSGLTWPVSMFGSVSNVLLLPWLKAVSSTFTSVLLATLCQWQSNSSGLF